MVAPALWFGGAQALLGIGGDLLSNSRKNRQMRDQLKFQRKREKFELNQYNKAVDAENAYNLMAHEIMKQQGEKQKGLIADAAQRAFLGNAINRDSQLRKLAFDRDNRQAQLLQAVGAGMASMEGDNRSAMRALRMGTEGVAGRQQVQDAYNVRGISDASRLRDQDVESQVAAQFAQIDARTAVAPFMRQHRQLGPQQKFSGGMSGWEMGIGALGHVMGGITTANSMLPKGKKWWG